MGILFSSFYGLTRLSDAGPEALGWSATDENFETISLLLRSHELHQHGGATPIKYPGYNWATPATPVSPTLTEYTSGGSLPPGSTLGVRLAYVNVMGLETEASPEATSQFAPAVSRANAPTIGDPIATPVQGLVGGGSYLYAITKRKGGSETDPSSIATVDIPFDVDNTYSVPLTFEPFNIYLDGTDSIRLYRSTGYASSFSLLKTITNAATTTFTDTNVLESQLIQPPATNQFNQFEKLNINWSSISHPASAYKLRVYVTREIGLWGTNSLLTELDMQDPATPLVNNIYYLGSEILGVGWPKEISQLASNPPKVNLGTETIGAPILTANMNFAGWQSWKFVLANNINNATPIDGALYYDASVPAFRARVAGNWLNLATPSAGSAVPYTHPSQEQGGHSTDNLPYKQIGGPSTTNILNIIATPVANYRRQITKVTKATATPISLNTSSTSDVYMVDMDTGANNIQPDFAGQWLEANFNIHISADALTTATFTLEQDGINKTETIRSVTVGPGQSVQLSTYLATPISLSSTRIKVKWRTSSGGITSVADYPNTARRTLVSKVLF